MKTNTAKKTKKVNELENVVKVDMFLDFKKH